MDMSLPTKDKTFSQLRKMAAFAAILTSLLFTIATADHIRLSYHPKPEHERHNLVWFNSSSFSDWSQQLDSYLETYRNPSLTKGRKESVVECDESSKEGSVCAIHPEKFGPCISTNYFGFKTGTPCIVIELKKVLNWVPKFYNSTKFLPKAMPASLKKRIEDGTPKEREMIWLTCEGETPADREAIGPVQYIPIQGFPRNFFPFSGQDGYLNPIVAVHFQNPFRGMIINVVCKAWAPGIKHDYRHATGLTHFQLLIDH